MEVKSAKIGVHCPYLDWALCDEELLNTQVDESGLASLEGKLPNRTICYHSYKIIK